ncbi:probable LRR receptor-like serine/threonine-protein kinase At3g47570 [Pistacia vera]|uniref:probable LRR receptor-like serine/threonine-protein kinase At3g47570 n=1 Tax=Pistacia vera TaxID=55513 RepID=UPI0012636708|nr:probable LRR receptor-like serine/threonine-protein kinase At3g47570 [Pistacia vera]
MGGVFSNANAISLSGNDKLYGGITELHLSNYPTKGSKQTRSISKTVIITIVVGIMLLTMMLCLIIIHWWRRTKRNSSSTSPLLASLPQVTYENLLKATAVFSFENLIGSGSFGYVYKGILDHNEMVVAVKVLNLQHRGASRSFLAKCEALRSIKHRNLVKIITVCASIDFQGNDFKALVYEFMVNGGLKDWLHPNLTTDVLQVVPRNLNFLQRLDIAINVACIMDYLHNHGQTPMAHCDLKPSNVLLDNELTGHVGDFGLARFLPQGTDSLSSNQTSSVGVRSTVGYAAPEYGMGSEVSTHGDVYSYGIFLLETFTGKRPTDELFNGDLNLHKFVKVAIPERVIEIVDPILLQETEEGQTSLRSHSVRECLISIFGIGVTCSSKSLSERTNMDDVTAQLHFIKNKLLQTPRQGERLLLFYNQLVGNIPTEPGSLSKLDFFAANDNQLTGSIPSSFGNLSSINTLSLSFNNLGGGIPDTLGQLKNLAVMFLVVVTSNRLGSGGRNDLNFLCSLSNATRLEESAINDNNFGGVLPERINNFSTTLKNATATLLMGNKKLCGGIAEFQMPTCRLNKSERRRLTLVLKLIIAILSEFLGLGLEKRSKLDSKSEKCKFVGFKDGIKGYKLWNPVSRSITFTARNSKLDSKL